MAESEKTNSMGIEKKHSVTSDDFVSDKVEGASKTSRDVLHTDTIEAPAEKLNALFQNPLEGISKDQLMKDVENFCQEHGLMDHVRSFRKGALVAQHAGNPRDIEELSEEDIAHLEWQTEHKWRQPWRLYWLCGEQSIVFLKR